MEKENVLMKQNFKKYLLLIAGVLVVIGVGCGITGCKSSGDGGSTTIVPPAVDDSGLPPDPGEAGQATLAGIDSDGDGVRDDVQRYIALTYPDSEKARAALTQYAVNVQDALIDANDKELSVQHGRESGSASACLIYVFETVSAKRFARIALDQVVLNTDERNYAYFTYNNQLGGEVFHGIPYNERASACEFDVVSLSD